MTAPAAQPVLFVTPRAFLTPAGGGGVQWCTREYHATLTAAGFAVHDLPFDIDRSPLARVLRRLRPCPYKNRVPRGFVAHVASQARRLGARWCFLNNTDALGLAAELRQAAPDLRLVFLSHGVELTDVVNNLRLAPETAPREQHSPLWLGRLLREEIRLRAALHGTVVISEPDLLAEEWLGSRAVACLPRAVPSAPLPLAPVAGRVGCVATLDHGPNLHGLRLFAAALAAHPGVRLRLVGGPDSVGRELAARHPAIDYLGRLDDASLHLEAATWRAFVNPIFCPARGASTKVATALGWGLPVLTTPHGARGYRWPADTLPLADDPAALAALAARVATAPDPAPWTAAADSIRRAAPDLAQSAALLGDLLARIAP